MHFSTLLATAYAFTAVSGHFMKRQVEDGLIPLLSSGASIYYPTDSGFTVSSERFTELNRPDFQLVVHVASEDDVVATVCPILLEDLFCFYIRQFRIAHSVTGAIRNSKQHYFPC
jgi:hypothetical protein